MTIVTKYLRLCRASGQIAQCFLQHQGKLAERITGGPGRARGVRGLDGSRRASADPIASGPASAGATPMAGLSAASPAAPTTSHASELDTSRPGSAAGAAPPTTPAQRGNEPRDDFSMTLSHLSAAGRRYSSLAGQGTARQAPGHRPIQPPGPGQGRDNGRLSGTSAGEPLARTSDIGYYRE